MLVVYDSLTGNVKRFIDKVRARSDVNVANVKDNPVVNCNYILVTYTTGFGQIPQSTKQFLDSNSENIIAVAVSGNINWGSSFGKCGDLISDQYKVPLLMKFELAGTEKNINDFIQEVNKFDNNSKMDSIK